MKTILKAVQPPRQKKKCEPSEKKLCVSVTFLLTQTDVLSSYAGQLSVRENEWGEKLPLTCLYFKGLFQNSFYQRCLRQ